MQAVVKKPDGIALAVTGARTLVPRLILNNLKRIEKLERVLVFDIQPPEVQDPDIAFYQIDLTAPGTEVELAEVMARHGTNVFLHGAFVWNPTRDTVWAHELESLGTDYVLAAVRGAGVKRFVLTSSVYVYGVSHHLSCPVKEEMPLKPDNVLPPFRDKVLVELALDRFSKANKDICVTVMRCAFALGKDVRTMLARTLRKKFVPVIWGFDPVFQVIHPEDLLDAYLTVIQNDHPGVYNIGPTDVVSLMDMIRVGGRIPLPLNHLITFPTTRWLWKIGITDFHPSILNYLRFSVIMDTSKAQDILGFKPKWSSRDTLLAFYNSLKD